MEDNQELDLVTLVDEDGDERTLEVLDYFFYEGKEYAVLTDYDEEHDHEHGEDCDCAGHDVDAYIMCVESAGDDEEEFLPIEDEGLMEKLIEFVQNELYGDGDDVDEDEIEEEVDDE